MKKIVLNEIDISPSLREPCTNEYIHAISRTTQNNSLNSSIKKFQGDRIVNEFYESAVENKDLKSLASYLFGVETKWIDHDMLEWAQQIEKKQPKTPEEWYVTAALRSLDEVFISDEIFPEFPVALNENNLNIREMVDLMTTEKYMYAERIFDTNYISQFFPLVKNTEFAKAISNAQIGFYTRYLETGNTLDLCLYLETCAGSLKFFENYDLRAEIEAQKNTNLNYYDFAKTFKKAFKSNKKMTKSEEFASARGLDLLSLTSIGCVAPDWYTKKLKELAQPLTIPSKYFERN